MVLWVLLAPLSGGAYETDQFSNRLDPIEDSADLLNERVNWAIHEAIADWLNDVVKTLDINNISLVAHSQGCLDALEFASRFPERLKSVSFIASGLATPVNEALISAAENDPEAAIAMMLGWGFGPAGQLHQGPIPGNSMVAGGRKVMRGNVPAELAADLRACDAYKNGKQAAAAIQAPAQVILAGKDRMAPRKAGLELVAHLPDPEVTSMVISALLLGAGSQSKRVVRLALNCRGGSMLKGSVSAQP